MIDTGVGQFLQANAQDTEWGLFILWVAILS